MPAAMTATSAFFWPWKGKEFLRRETLEHLSTTCRAEQPNGSNVRDNGGTIVQSAMNRLKKKKTGKPRGFCDLHQCNVAQAIHAMDQWHAMRSYISTNKKEKQLNHVESVSGTPNFVPKSSLATTTKKEFRGILADGGRPPWLSLLGPTKQPFLI